MSQEETEKRLKALQSKLKERGLKGAILFSPINIFYFTGFFVKGFLFVSEREVSLNVRRPYNLVKERLPFPVLPIESLKKLPEMLKIKAFKRVGIDFRAFNYEEGKRFETLLSDFELINIDDLVWDLRMIKSKYEINCHKQASRKLKQALKESLKLFRPAMREIEASAIIEKALRELGHPGYTRSFNNFELTYGYLISGKEGLFVLPFTTGEGGKGVEGFSGGASFKRLKKGEPILIDFSGFYRGYYVDQTRMASFGRCKSAEPFFRASLEILTTLEKKAKPGMLAEELYFIATAIAEKYGFQEYFMRHGEKMTFIGHGVGLEIDEPPVLAIKNKRSIEENMVIALEPKFHVPGLGVVGLEDTFLVTKAGLKRITNFPRDWLYLKEN
ncbi:MAG: M24 family metallopeptidase [Caldimicrobium sp.]